jgi:hypothetical protein
VYEPMCPHGMESQVEQPYSGAERRTSAFSADVEPVVLTRKLAQAIDGVNLEGRDVGERLPLPRREARLLIAEGWAMPVPLERRRPLERGRSS